MGSWLDTQKEILDSTKDSNIEDMLTTTALAFPTFFDIERMRTYFGFAEVQGKIRIDITYRTSITNVRSAMHAARISSAITDHINSKLEHYRSDAVSWDATPSGAVTVNKSSVDFFFYLFIRKNAGTTLPFTQPYVSKPAELTRTWKQILEDAGLDYLDTTKPALARYKATASTATNSAVGPTVGDRFRTRYQDTVKDLPEKVLIGVYGSLRHGMHNHVSYLYGCKQVTDVRVPGTLFALGDIRTATVPGAIFDDAQTDKSIVIEIYECPKHVVRRLDQLEGWDGNPKTSSYQRKIITARTETEDLQVYVYEYPRLSTASIVEDGDWTAHRRRMEKR